MSGLYGWVAASGYVLLIGSVLLYFISTLLGPKRKAERRKPELAPEPGPDYKRIAELEHLCSPLTEYVVARAESAAAYYYENPDRLYATHPHVRDFGYPVVILHD